MAICRGCGATLQHEDPEKIGYTPKEDSLYCKRCFRLMHYDDLTVSLRQGIDPDVVLDKINKQEGLIVWVVDLFDFEAGMIKGLSRKLLGRDIILVATKRDLLPKVISNQKLAQFIFARLKEYQIVIQELTFTSMHSKEGTQAVLDSVKRHANHRPIIVMGKANSGKSTLLNALCGEEIVTSSRYPGTTLDMNTVEAHGFTWIDTPGLEIENSMLMKIDEKDLKVILPTREVKPMGFQIYEDQSFALGGLCRIDCKDVTKASIIIYEGEKMPLPHRCKVSKADELWQNQYGKLLSPIPTTKEVKTYTLNKKEEKVDVVIDGLGWMSIKGKVKTICVTVPKGVNVTLRKAMF